MQTVNNSLYLFNQVTFVKQSTLIIHFIILHFTYCVSSLSVATDNIFNILILTSLFSVHC